MRRRRERAAKTRKLLVVNCVQLVAAAAVRGVCTKYELVEGAGLQRWSLSLCTRPPLDGDCKQRLHVCSAHDGRAGLHDELLAKTIHPCSLSLSLSLQPTSSPLLHPPCCLSTNLQKLKIDQLSQNMKISVKKRQNKLCLL